MQTQMYIHVLQILQIAYRIASKTEGLGNSVVTGRLHRCDKMQGVCISNQDISIMKW